MKKIITILGARPQFIKSSVVSRELNKQKGIKEMIIHTGQHFDSNMSEIFFEQLDLEKPAFNLGIHGLDHGAMTGRMLEKIELILIKELPDLVLVYGDTNSTLAGALAAAKLHIPVAHVEAGLRSYNHQMPEEINRILVDRISTYLFCPTTTAVENLKNEGFSTKKHKLIITGDVMYDSVKLFSEISSSQASIFNELNLNDFVLSTVHRPENTDSSKNLKAIFSALKSINKQIQVVIPLHPRTQKNLKKFKINTDGLKVIDPVSYFDMLQLLKSSKVVLTDSGGLQKEAFFLQRPSVILRNETEWVELVKNKFAFLSGCNQEKILYGFTKMVNKKVTKENYYGNGRAAEKIVRSLDL